MIRDYVEFLLQIMSYARLSHLLIILIFIKWPTCKRKLAQIYFHWISYNYVPNIEQYYAENNKTSICSMVFREM